MGYWAVAIKSKQCAVKVKNIHDGRLICQGNPLEVFDFMRIFDARVEFEVIGFLFSNRDARLLNHLDLIVFNSLTGEIVKFDPNLRQILRQSILENVSNIVYPLRDIGYNSFWYEIYANDLISP